MSTKTPYLGLILPANSEYSDSWDKPLNKNFELLDASIEVVTTEVQAARFSLPTLSAFLSVGLNPDGTVKPTTDVTNAANSSVYGSHDSSGVNYTVKRRLDLGDEEVFAARLGFSSLRSSLGFLGRDNDYPDTVLSGTALGNGAPSIMTILGSDFILNGAAKPIVFNIDGRRMELSDNLTVTASGADGRKMLVATVPASPHVVTTSNNGAVILNSDNGKLQILEDSGANFPLLKVRPGMLLTLVGSNEGTYVIDQVSVGAVPDARRLAIKGVFQTDETGVGYQITDPLRPSIDSLDPILETAGSCVIGEAVLAAGNLSQPITYSFKRKYVSAYTGIDVSVTAVVELAFPHNLGRLPKNIQLFISQAADESLPVEPLSVCHIDSSSMTVTMTDTQVFSAGTWTPATAPTTATPDYNPLPSLSGTITGAISGAVTSRNSVRVQISKTEIRLKNIVNNKLYTDYGGTPRTSGFIQVVVS